MGFGDSGVYGLVRGLSLMEVLLICLSLVEEEGGSGLLRKTIVILTKT